MSLSTETRKEQMSTSAPESHSGVLVARRHHLPSGAVQPLAELAHPSGTHPEWRAHLLGVSPVYKHKSDPQTGSFDPLADFGRWICVHEPGLHQYSSPPDWVYNHISLGPGILGGGPASSLALYLTIHSLRSRQREASGPRAA